MRSPTSRLGLFVAALIVCASAFAGPAEEAQSAFLKFFPAFVARNQSNVAAMFAPDAQFYGTLSRELVSTPQGVIEYFRVALDRPDTAVATPLHFDSLALSDTVVAIAGSWKLDRTLNGQTASTGPYRLTAVMQKRDGNWFVVQFHNSPLPPAPSASASQPR